MENNIIFIVISQSAYRGGDLLLGEGKSKEEACVDAYGVPRLLRGGRLLRGTPAEIAVIKEGLLDS